MHKLVQCTRALSSATMPCLSASRRWLLPVGFRSSFFANGSLNVRFDVF